MDDSPGPLSSPCVDAVLRSAARLSSCRPFKGSTWLGGYRVSLSMDHGENRSSSSPASPRVRARVCGRRARSRDYASIRGLNIGLKRCDVARHDNAFINTDGPQFTFFICFIYDYHIFTIDKKCIKNRVKIFSSYPVSNS